MTTYYIKNDDSESINFNTSKRIYSNSQYEVFEITSCSKSHQLNFNKYINNIAKQKQSGIEFMLANPPISLKGDNFRICWPKYSAFDSDNNLVGYLAPKGFENSISLTSLIDGYNDKLDSQWGAFLDNSQRSCELRLKLCANLAQALASITDINQYALSPENILITADAKVSLVALDLMLMNKKLNPLFSFDSSALMGYLPAEAIQGAVDANNNSVARFSLAVIMYKLLFGVHPYDAKFKPPHSNHSSIQDKIENDLFVHGAGKTHVLDLAEEHKTFEALHHSLKSPFQLAFNDRHKLQRPSPKKWQDILFTAIADNNHGLKPKAVDPISAVPTVPTARPPVTSPTTPINTSGNSTGIPISTPVTTAKKANDIWVIAGILVVSIIIAALVVTSLNNDYEEDSVIDAQSELDAAQRELDLAAAEGETNWFEEEEDEIAYLEPDPIGELTNEYLYVMYERANIRSNPSISAPVVTDVAYNTRLTRTTLSPITKGERVWINVATANNVRGWISSSTVSQYPRTIFYSKCGVNRNELEYIVESTGVNVRSQPNKNDASVIGVIQKGEFVCPYMYVDSNDRSVGRWLGFALTSGGTAWVAEALLTPYYSYQGNSIVYEEEFNDYEEEEEVYGDELDSDYF